MHLFKRNKKRSFVTLRNKQTQDLCFVFVTALLLRFFFGEQLVFIFSVPLCSPCAISSCCLSAFLQFSSSSLVLPLPLPPAPLSHEAQLSPIFSSAPLLIVFQSHLTSRPSIIALSRCVFLRYL